MNLIYRQNEALILFVLFALLLLATELGYWVGRRHKKAGEDAPQISTIQGSVLGLLALLLGFTFALSASRFEARKQLVVDEANAIGTVFLRAQFLPEPYDTKSQDLLRKYVSARLEFFSAGADENKLQKAVTGSEQINKALWAYAVAAADKASQPILVNLYVQALNEMIDLHTSRSAALQNRVPEVIILLVMSVAVLAMASLGYGLGYGTHRLRLVTALMSLVIALVIIVIIDLDRPRRGVITVNQNVLIETQQGLLKSDN